MILSEELLNYYFWPVYSVNYYDTGDSNHNRIDDMILILIMTLLMIFILSVVSAEYVSFQVNKQKRIKQLYKKHQWLPFGKTLQY